MKLQEAFMERNDLRKKINRVESELNTVIVTEEDQPLEFDPKMKLKELVDLQDDLFRLNVAIDKANIVNIEKLQQLRILDEKIKLYSNLRSTLLSWKKHQTRGWAETTTIVMNKNFDLNEVTQILESLEQRRRNLDRDLQRSNWETEVDNS